MAVQSVPTIKEMARQLNLSSSTVSRALNGNTSIGLRTKMRVKQLADQLSYAPNLNAISLKQKKTFIIGVIVPNLREHFFSEAVCAIEDLALQNKYHVLINQSQDDPERERQIVESMKSLRVDGIIASLSKNTQNCDHFLSLKNYNIPVVYFDRVPNRQDVHKVVFNMHSGTKDALEHLYARGHRRIAILNGPETMASSIERTNAYKQVMIKKRIKIDMSLVVSTDLTQAGTFEAMDNLMAQHPRPTAVVAMNDYVALDVIEYAKKTKLKINKDLCVISYANLPIITYLQTPPVASVEQYPWQQGAKAAGIMMDLIRNNDSDEPPVFQHVIIDGKLMVHEKRKR